MTKEECIALLERYAEYDGMGIPNLAGCKEAMKMAADLLSQPSLPSNLDEAAWKYGLDNQSGFYSQSVKVDCFKAGAEWMAGQGYTVDGIVICDKELTGGYKDIVMSIPDELKVDDKVTIQIRKR